MNYPNIRKINSKLAENENLSDHNKEVLEDYFRDALSSGSPKKTTLRDYSSRWNKMAEVIDFKIDQPERKDILNLMSDINTDELKKDRGNGTYSNHSKQKFLKTITTFYNNFIDYENQGYRSDTDGPVLIRGLDLVDQPAKQIRKEKKPTPAQVKQVLESTRSLQERAVISFIWATGCRIGEVFVTDDKDNCLVWEDINFRDDDVMSVRLGKSFKPSDPRRRRVLTPIAKPIMFKLFEERNPDPDDPVFYRRNDSLHCPNCEGKPEPENRATFERRKYSCSECSWTGRGKELNRSKEPMTDDTVRGILKKAIERSPIHNVDNTPHKFGRKARALHKQANNWGEGSMRNFFGWSEGSDAPGFYKEALEVNQKQDIAQQHPELDVDIDGRFLDDALKPTKCSNCDALVSPLWNLCRKCGHEQTYQGLEMKGGEVESKKNRIKNQTKDEIIQYLKNRSDIDDEELEEAMVERLNQNMEEKGLL